ncbi:MAG: hypothetical protein J6A37_06795 [Oscillospiraceae bacterium]|nr:hypothetical protein [Oscillospiraceae bacterium]
MTVGEIVYRIIGDDTQFNSVMGRIGSTASKAMSIISEAALAASAAAAAAVAALAKSAVAAFSEYEQLVGGVETLFKDSAETVKRYADNAYKNAGMSANEYMSTVTSFSASLLQGLGGDTAKAAEIANQAIVDMSDNANKMGSDIETLKTAYANFAKGQFMLLDNLKLGYGGTQAEMARLINDSGVLGDSMTVTAETVNSVSFDKMIEAIHVIQTEMGITDTTAKEAATTIQGSIAAMKGAYQNLLTGIADPAQDFDRLISNLVDSVIIVTDNLMPRIMAVLPQMAVGITELAADLLPLIPETLEAMLPDVISGGNALISALLDTLSSLAETAIPIVTENADEIVGTLLSGLTDSLPEVALSAVDLCSALITAILDNADILAQGAADVVSALAEGLGDNLDVLIPAAVGAAIDIAVTALDNIDPLIDAVMQLMVGVAEALPDTLGVITEKIPVVLGSVVNAFVDGIETSTVDIGQIAIEMLGAIADGLVNYDWSTSAEITLNNMCNALDNAQKNTQVFLDNLLSGGELYGGDINNVRSTEFVNSYKAGIDETVDIVEKGSESLKTAYDDGMAMITGAADPPDMGKKWLEAEKEREAAAKAVLNREKERAEEWKKAQAEANGAESAPDGGVDSVVRQSEMLEAALSELEHNYKIHAVTESEYWAERKRLLEAYSDRDSEEWNELYDEVTEHYEKLAETEAKAAERAAKEKESSLKKLVSDKFRELETEQLEKGYDDSWLTEQQRAFIDTLDHNSEVYKDYNLTLLKEQKAADEKAAKEAESAAEKQRDSLERAYNSVISSRNSLASRLSQSGDIFNVSEDTDKRTGAKTRSRSIDLEAFEKKIQAKKQLASKIAELLEKDTPDEIISELLELDPEDALHFANELLRSPKKLARLSEGFEKDSRYSSAIADIVTENSEDFSAMGNEAGSLFGESFMAAFRENWETAMESVFADKDFSVNASAAISFADRYAAQSTYIPREYTAESSQSGAYVKSFAESGNHQSFRVIDINGRYIATVVNAENARSARTGGR